MILYNFKAALNPVMKTGLNFAKKCISYYGVEFNNNKEEFEGDLFGGHFWLAI